MKTLRFAFGLITIIGLTSRMFADDAAHEKAMVINQKMQLVIKDKDGNEVLQPVGQLKSNQVIQYTSVCENFSDHTLRDIPVVSKVSEYAIYQGGADNLPTTGIKVEYSLDEGKTFSSPPLTFKIQIPGKPDEMETATSDMYNAVRWTISEIKPGQKFELSYRAVIR